MDIRSPWDDVPSKGQADSNNATADSPKPPAVTTSAGNTVRSATGRKLPIRKVAVQPTSLESVDDATDPLGPLGTDSPPHVAAVSAESQAPTPPRKEISSSPPVPIAEDGDAGVLSSASTRGPPPVQLPPGAASRQAQPSLSLEQAAKPTFHISVGDPHKVGDLATSHIVYQVQTRTTSKAYRNPEFAVSRRYRDFLWLYNSLHNNNPGVVVPAPPEKQAVGRFETDFVESRRQALERMLNKIAAHPVLQHDADLKIFLESDSFNIDIKNKENREPDLGQSKGGGVFSAIGINVGGTSSGKFVEHDDWFHDRKIYLDALENQLKALLKALETVMAQRKSLAEAAGEFAASLGNLARVELSPDFSGPVQGLSDVQVRIKELYERQAQQDMLTLGITVDEYIRLIGSVKTAFRQRQKAFHSWHAAESELQKRRSGQEKLLKQGKSQQDKLNEVNAGVSDAEKKAHQARLLFEDMGKLMRSELDRFEREKVEDFKSGVETFLEGAVEAQKELIELWETFLLQLDADDELNPATDFYSSANHNQNTTSQTASATSFSDVSGLAARDAEGPEQELIWYPMAAVRDLTLSDQELDKKCPLSQHRRGKNGQKTPESEEYGLARLEMLPLEVLSLILVQLDIASLMSLQRINHRGFDAVNEMPQLRAIIHHCPNVLRGILSTEMASFIQCQQLFSKLTSHSRRRFLAADFRRHMRQCGPVVDNEHVYPGTEEAEEAEEAEESPIEEAEDSPIEEVEESRSEEAPT
ncbi:hypothetical protein DV738_g3361, partial [Chaetothyriales sp. CBS 135597]